MGYTYKQKGSKNWWIKYYRNGRPFRESSGSAKEGDAKRLLQLREGDIARGVPITPKIGRVTIDELVEAVVNDYKKNNKKTLKDLERRWRKHLQPFFGGRRASSITTADVDRFIVQRQQGAASPEQIREELADLNCKYAAAVDEIQRANLSRRGTQRQLRELKHTHVLASKVVRGKKGATNGEINRETKILSRAFSLAIESGRLVSKPSIHDLREDNVRTGFFERDKFEEVLKHLPEHVAPVARFAYVTGWRTLSEVLPLQWRQIDFRAGVVTLDPGTTKNKDGRVFPFTTDLRLLLEELKEKNEAMKRDGLISPWVFTYNGRQFKSYYRSWKTACRKAAQPGMLSHDFRRTAVRNLVRAGVPERVAMQMTGHKTRSVFDRYHIVSQGDLFDAAKRLDLFAGIAAGIVSTKDVQSFVADSGK